MLSKLNPNGSSSRLEKVGLFAMLVTTALWALAFVAPLVVPTASAFELTLGRFFVYGIISVLSYSFKKFLRLPRPILLRAFLYAMTGNILYYTLLVFGIKTAGGVLAVLIIGLLPVAIATTGMYRSQQDLRPSQVTALVLFTCGLLVILFSRAKMNGSYGAIPIAGVLSLVGALIMWTWYAVGNAEYLKNKCSMSSQEWASVVGIATFVTTIFGLFFGASLGLVRNPLSLNGGEFIDLAFWSILLGVGSTWTGTFLFNFSSRHIPISIVGQLIIFEQIFGLVYVYLVGGIAIEHLTLFGISICLCSLWVSLRYLSRSRMS